MFLTGDDKPTGIKSPKPVQETKMEEHQKHGTVDGATAASGVGGAGNGTICFFFAFF